MSLLLLPIIDRPVSQIMKVLTQNLLWFRLEESTLQRQNIKASYSKHRPFEHPRFSETHRTRLSPTRTQTIYKCTHTHKYIELSIYTGEKSYNSCLKRFQNLPAYQRQTANRIFFSFWNDIFPLNGLDRSSKTHKHPLSWSAGGNQLHLLTSTAYLQHSLRYQEEHENTKNEKKP